RLHFSLIPSSVLRRLEAYRKRFRVDEALWRVASLYTKAGRAGQPFRAGIERCGWAGADGIGDTAGTSASHGSGDVCRRDVVNSRSNTRACLCIAANLSE